MARLVRWMFCVCLLGVCGFTFAQPVAVVNPSFEDADATGAGPAAWTLSGGSGDWTTDAAAGAHALSATGNGAQEQSNHWISEPLNLDPLAVYLLRFQARRVTGSGGCPVSGPFFCNRDLSELDAAWQEITSAFAAPSVPDAAASRLRFGQWEVNGTVAYDDIELMRAQPVYRLKNGIALGEGETVCGNTYTFRAPMDTLKTNHARPLAVNRCWFNAPRWAFGPDCEVVYRLEVGGIAQQAARVEVNVGYYVGGTLNVEASANGADWQPLGVISAAVTQSFAIPEALFPAKEVWIRMSAAAESASIQVYGFAYEATLETAPGDMRGGTQYLAVCENDPQVDVEVLSLGEAIPGGENEVIARVNNRTSKPIRLRPRIDVCQGKLRARSRGEQTIKPGMNEVRFAYDITATGTVNAVLTMGSAVNFRAETTFEVSDLFDTDFGECLPDSDKHVALWWASSGWKVSQVRPVPEKRGRALRIEAAQNEAEAAQFVIRPDTPLRALSVEAEPLAGPGDAEIPAANVDLLRVRYVNITRPTDDAGAVAPWPDPLPQFTKPADVAAGRNQPVWVRVRVPREAPAGEYRGRIHVRAEGYEAEVPVVVEVFDFTMPDRMTCVSAFGFNPDCAFQYQRVVDPDQRRAVYDQYLSALSAHHITPYDATSFGPLSWTWPEIPPEPRTPEQIAALKPTFQWEAWDREMTLAFEKYHFNSFQVPVPGLGGGTFHSRSEPELCGFGENTPEYKALFSSWCKQMEDHLREKGWLNDSYAYWFDEPDPKDYEFVANGFRKLKEAAPGIGRMLTEQIEPALAGAPNIWCPLTPAYDFDAAEQRRAEGDRFWWYVCTGPKAPYVTLFIDHPATEMRVWLWQTWERKIDGILIWHTTYWHSPEAYPDKLQNPYEDPMSWTTGYSTPSGTKLAWGNGDGRFLYPPEAAADGNPPQPVLDPPVDTIRIEMLRDGIEDYEYLAILRRLIEEKAGVLSAGDLEQARALLEVPDEITSGITAFTRDPAPIEARRTEVARMIERLRVR